MEMRKIKRDLLDRISHIPSNVLGFAIIIIGLSLVASGKITMDQFTAFALVALPFFFYKNNGKKSEEKTE